MLAEEAKPRTKAEILALLKSNGEKFAAYLEGLSESFLAEPVAMPPGAQPATKSRLRDAAVAQGARNAPSRAS